MLETSMGNIKLELFEKDAPVTVANFLTYVDEGHYDSTIFTGEAPSIQKQSDSVAVTENSVPAAQNSVSPEKADNAPEPA